VDLSDVEYEYRPPYYHEKICRSYGDSEIADAGNQVCGFFSAMTEVLVVTAYPLRSIIT
jgi:hypothetical protein